MSPSDIVRSLALTASPRNCLHSLSYHPGLYLDLEGFTTFFSNTLSAACVMYSVRRTAISLLVVIYMNDSKTLFRDMADFSSVKAFLNSSILESDHLYLQCLVHASA